MIKKFEIARLEYILGESEFDYSNWSICHGKGSGGGTNTVTNNSQPPAAVMAAYQDVLGKAQNVSGQPLQQYQNPIVAGFTPDQSSAFNTINQSQGISNPYINSASQLIGQSTQPLWNNTQQFSPSAVQQYMSPYTQNVVGTTEAQMQNMDQQQQQALTGNAISKGAWGGDRAGVASAVLSGQQDLANNATIAGLENQGYGQGLQEFNTQQQAQLGANEANQYLASQGAFGMGNLGNEAQSTTLQGANSQLQAGALQQQLGQEALNVPYQQFLQQQAYPFQTTQYLANIGEGIGGASGGTSSTTSPAPSALSQFGGLGLSGLSLAGSLGAFSGGSGAAAGGIGSAFGSLYDLAPLALASKGGAIKGYDMGGGVSPPPDLSLSFIPSAQSQPHGLGIPSAPKPYTPPPPTQFTNFMDAQHMDDGGTVGGMSPITPQIQGMNPTQQSYASSYQNMSPEQLQMLAMRLPPGSQQSRQVTAILQQKRMMPNVGVQAQGGFSPQQPSMARGGMTPRHYDTGGSDVSEIPYPPTPDQIQSQSMGPPPPPGEVSTPSGGIAPVDQTAPEGQKWGSHTKTAPWESLMAAGAGMMAGQSPYAAVNIGQGMLAGLKNQHEQQQENREEQQVSQTGEYQKGELGVRGDEVKNRALQLANELQWHKDQLGIEQQNANTNEAYRKDLIDLRKNPPESAEKGWELKTDAMGHVYRANKNTGEVEPMKMPPMGGMIDGAGNPQDTPDINSSISSGKFGFPVPAYVNDPVVMKGLQTADTARIKSAQSNRTIGRNILSTLDDMDANYNDFYRATPGSSGYKALLRKGEAFTGIAGDDQATASANIDKNSNNLVNLAQKFEYVPGGRGSVMALKTIAAGKPGTSQPLETNNNISNEYRAQVNDALLTDELAGKYRALSGLPADENVNQLADALQKMYPITTREGRNTIYHPENVQKVRDSMDDALANPKKYMGGGQQQGSTGQTGASQGQMVRVRGPNGQAGSISSTELPDAIKNGWQQVQ